MFSSCKPLIPLCLHHCISPHPPLLPHLHLPNLRNPLPYLGNVSLPPGAPTLELCSPIWTYFQPPNVQVHVQQSFLPYSHLQNQQQQFYGLGTTLINEFDQEVQTVPVCHEPRRVVSHVTHVTLL